ncbi:Uncharacterised protein [Fluoribacter dumoffii]|uniref:Uncharacterized protein n=1 Tax=Fluoribacter dumoffii TaxID=463 RepID=A0A377GEJ6_9GAMM|nr:hypothetical protein Ldum_2357 [Fluoribacter dumoffii NY 23]STO22989.1 Uncharacterised protein [Fluoribacter dumoffii]
MFEAKLLDSRLNRVAEIFIHCDLNEKLKIRYTYLIDVPKTHIYGEFEHTLAPIIIRIY